MVVEGRVYKVVKKKKMKPGLLVLLSMDGGGGATTEGSGSIAIFLSKRHSHYVTYQSRLQRFNVVKVVSLLRIRDVAEDVYQQYFAQCKIFGVDVDTSFFVPGEDAASLECISYNLKKRGRAGEPTSDGHAKRSKATADERFCPKLWQALILSLSLAAAGVPDHSTLQSVTIPAVAKSRRGCDAKACRFRHTLYKNARKIEVEMQALKRSVQRRIQNLRFERAALSDNGTVPAPAEKLDKKFRHKLFAEWLFKTYLEGWFVSNNQDSITVLDVAGGNGALASELKYVFETTVRRHGERAEPWALAVVTIDPLGATYQQRSKARLASQTGEQNRTIPTAGSTFSHQYLPQPFTDETCATLALKRVVEGASLIVGMHPDQATECIVATAEKYKKPMALLPCCVFSSLFPDRRVPTTGLPVTNYPTFVEYLKLTYNGVRSTSLGFEGKNLVLYRTLC
jgi:hypothetical protein